MKWINHQVVTGFMIYAATDNALFVASGILGAVLPDRVEGSPPREKKAYWKWRKNHRTWSHYPPLYLALIFAAQYAKNYLSFPGSEIVLNVLSYIFVGALLHIVQDGICGKVPILTPHGKHGLKLFKVGSWREYFFVVLIIGACLFYKFKEIFLQAI